MELTVSRKAHFNAAHRLFNNEWSKEKNYDVFGKCNNPNFHGHNYELIVSVTRISKNQSRDLFLFFIVLDNPINSICYPIYYFVDKNIFK